MNAIDEPISTSRFTYNPDTKTLVAEASDLLLNTIPNYLCVQSERTGRVVVFTRTVTHRDAEGEITDWIYEALDLDGLNRILDVVVQLFND